MTERKLATIRRIKALTPIKDADRIELAQVDGWNVVVQKGLYEVCDLVVYFEIDSLLPEVPEFEFLRKSSYVKPNNSANGAGFRLKTIKLKGQISQGLIVPMRELEKYLLDDGDNPYAPTRPTALSYYEEGDDVTAFLGVQKYEKPIPANLRGMILRNFPDFIPKTNQERIQNFYDDFQKNYNHHAWEVTTKLDGSSMTVYYDAEEDRFGVCSRNIDLKETEDNLYWKVARKLDLETKIREHYVTVVLSRGYTKYIAWQGELMGPGVQGNRENLDEHMFYMFDFVVDVEYQTSSVRDWVSKWYKIPHVPIVDFKVLSGFNSVDDFLKYAEGPSINNPVREGLVFKSLFNPSVSFKAISNKFLLGEE